MKKELFEVPEFEVERFALADIVCASECEYKCKYHEEGEECPREI